MRRIRQLSVSVALSACLAAGSFLPTAATAETLTVAYFPGWPTTHHIGAAKGWFSEALGMDVRFVQFDTGTAMASAMLSGSVPLAYSLGVMPLTLSVSKGAPLKAIGTAVSYAKSDNCVVSDSSDIAGAEDLAGAKVGVPFGTVSHYKLMSTLDHLGVDPDTLEFYDMQPASVAAALARGDLDMGCAWEPALSRMLERGHVLVSADTQESWGLKVFDNIAVTQSFAKENPELLTRFLEVVDRSTRYYRDHPEESYEIIGRSAGISPEMTKDIMSKMTFLTRDQQLSPEWMGTTDKPGAMTDYMQKIAQFMLDQGELDSALDDYGTAVDPQYYEAVAPAAAAD